MNKHEQTAVYPRTKFKDVPRDLADLLSSLKGFRGKAIGERDYGSLAESIAKTEPFTIILFTELLAFEHARRKDYEFLIIPDSMGSNCEVDNKIVSAMMAGTWKVKKVESPDYSEIKEIRIFY